MKKIKMNEKIINFIPDNDFTEKFIQYPVSATKFIPSWYSKSKLFFHNEQNYGLIPDGMAGSPPNTTIKGCTPFLDALTVGYMVCLPLDLEIRKINNDKNYRINWRFYVPENDFVTIHSDEQIAYLPKPVNGKKDVFKWESNIAFNVPNGYSIFFTHPLNRHDLPFRTFSGIVDADKYGLSVKFPFQLLDIKENPFIIEKGTPICQFFPFKRDNWKSNNKKHNEKEKIKKYFDFMSIIKRSYKNNYWSSKTFK